MRKSQAFRVFLGTTTTVIKALFILTLILEIVYLALFILTIRLPGFRFWPPPSARSWQFFASWLIAGVVAMNFLILGLMDFNNAPLRSWNRFPAALVILVIGSTIGTWSYITLGMRITIGLGEKLVTRGPYRYTRNPQYIGDSLNIIAYMVLTNSRMAWGIGLLGIALNLLAPFTEEPWLEERFGEAYRAYKNQVPRFLGPGKGAAEKQS
jgi:protein-S-isoprenylcysteine O-methyltransferase Ste14